MPENRQPRVLIADDHALIAEAFEKLLASHCEVVGIATDGRSLVENAIALKPDVVLVDVGMPLLNGLQAAERIKRALPSVKVIYVTVNHDPDLVAEAFRQGASGYLPKTAAVSELVAAIESAIAGDLYTSRLLEASTDFNSGQTAASRLTDRQIEVLQLLAEGKSMKEAAAVLKLTTRTVAFHKYRIMEHLQLKNDAEVVQYAMRHHLLFN